MPKYDTKNETASIDVVMCTWNSSKPWYKKCLLSIKREIPVHCFILVDRHSKDDTIAIVKSIFPKAIVIKTNSNLARQRSLGIKKVDTQWFLFCDDDIEFTEGWYSKIMSHIGEPVSALNGITLSPDPRLIRAFSLRSNIWHRIKEARELRETDVEENPDSRRGLGGNTLVKTAYAVDWNPPAILSAYEDHHLKRHILKKGGKWILVLEAIAWHHREITIRTMVSHERWNAAGGRLIGALTLPKILKEAVLGIFASLYAAVNSGIVDMILLAVAQHFGRIQGYLAWERHLVLERHPDCCARGHLMEE